MGELGCRLGAHISCTMQRCFRIWDVKSHELPGLLEMASALFLTEQDDELKSTEQDYEVKSTEQDQAKNCCRRKQFLIESKKYRWATEWNSQINFLIRDAKERLDACSLDSLSTKGLIEFHNYSVDGNCKFIFGEHVDDDGGVPYCVNSVIYYLIKSDSIAGGDLKIKGEVIDVRPLKDHYKVVCFAGNVLHDVTSMQGLGQRLSVIVQLYTDSR